MIVDTLQKNQVFFHLEVTYGESYIEGMTKGTNQYRINIQGGSLGIKLPKELCLTEYVTLYFQTQSGNEINLYCKTEIGNDWIEIYDNFLTTVLFDDLPTSFTIEYDNSIVG